MSLWKRVMTTLGMGPEPPKPATYEEIEFESIAATKRLLALDAAVKERFPLPGEVPIATEQDLIDAQDRDWFKAQMEAKVPAKPPQPLVSKTLCQQCGTQVVIWRIFADGSTKCIDCADRG